MGAAVAAAYAPSHITGFFAMCESDKPLLKGSVGCGIVIEAGCVTHVTLRSRIVREIENLRVELNGKVEQAPTTRYVVEHMLSAAAGIHRSSADHTSAEDLISAEDPTSAELIISSVFDVPLQNGFGTSAAGALSTALALNDILSLNLTMNGVAEIAHLAEIENRTGLGDVIAEVTGGIVIRKKPGPPGIGETDRIPCVRENVSYVVIGSGKETRKILEEASSESSLRRRINKAGREAMRELLRKPSVQNFMMLSRDFTLKTELVSDKCVDAIEAVASHDSKIASVAMLGEVVFVIGESRTLKEFGTVRKSRISNYGATLLRPSFNVRTPSSLT